MNTYRERGHIVFGIVAVMNAGGVTTIVQDNGTETTANAQMKSLADGWIKILNITDNTARIIMSGLLKRQPNTAKITVKALTSGRGDIKETIGNVLIIAENRDATSLKILRSASTVATL